MKKNLLSIFLVILIVAVAAGGYFYYQKQHPTSKFQASNMVLQQLKAGNLRFLTGKPKEHDYEKQILNSKRSQSPDTIVLSCSDSRAIPELVFDQGIGHVFTIRIAGNVINKDILGSMEYAADILGSKLIVVLAHTNCGAVSAACKGVKYGNLTDLLEEIQPAAQTVKVQLKENNCKDPQLINAIAKQNVLNMMKQIPEQSPIIANLIKNGKVKIVGGIYNIKNGKVTFFENTSIKKSQKNELFIATL
ncbi:MAG: carbonic anhydrase [Coxiellaceae bacterium]|nr:carbonic anhydrase [Coxiellaceae bacterium]